MNSACALVSSPLRDEPYRKTIECVQEISLRFLPNTWRAVTRYPRVVGANHDILRIPNSSRVIGVSPTRNPVPTIAPRSSSTQIVMYWRCSERTFPTPFTSPKHAASSQGRYSQALYSDPSIPKYDEELRPPERAGLAVIPSYALD